MYWDQEKACRTIAVRAPVAEAAARAERAAWRTGGSPEPTGYVSAPAHRRGGERRQAAGARPGHVQQRPAGGHGPHRRAEPAHPRRFAGRQLVAHVEAPGGGEVGDEGDRRRRGAGRFRARIG